MRTRILNYLLMAAMVFSITFAITSCSNNDDDNTTTDLNVAEKIMGKWIVSEVNGLPAMANTKRVFDFVSATKAYYSASLSSRPEGGALWVEKLEVDVAIVGNKVTVTIRPDKHQTTVEVFDITAINATEFAASHKITVSNDGRVVYTTDNTVRFTKVTADYAKAIIGLWECQEMTGGETFNDTNARLEFLTDGTYRFYRKNDAWEWILVPRELNEYFVEGNFLATRWQSAGEPIAYEWWEIASLSDDQMLWTALRQNADGSAFQQGTRWKRVE